MDTTIFQPKEIAKELATPMFGYFIMAGFLSPIFLFQQILTSKNFAEIRLKGLVVTFYFVREINYFKLWVPYLILYPGFLINAIFSKKRINLILEKYGLREEEDRLRNKKIVTTIMIGTKIGFRLITYPIKSSIVKYSLDFEKRHYRNFFDCLRQSLQQNNIYQGFLTAVFISVALGMIEYF